MSTTPDKTPTAAQSVEETLVKTDFGQVINDNKKPILVIAAISIVLIIFYAIFDHFQETKRKDKLEEVFKLESSLFIPFLQQDSKVSVEDFRSDLTKVDKKFIGHPNLVPSYLQSLNKIAEQGTLSAADLDGAKNWLAQIDKRSELNLFVGLRVAILLENNGRADEAIAILEDIQGKNYSVLSDRINFELGRMYFAKGNTDKAQANLEKVVASEQQSDYKNMAKIYLSEL